GAKRGKAGDRSIALTRSGLHSNGHSRFRKVFAYDLDRWRAELLKPTAPYVQAKRQPKELGVALHAACRLTCVGLDQSLRVLPEHTAVQLKPWPVPAPFKEVKARTGEEWSGLLRTLNCGLGFVLFVDAASGDRALKLARETGHEAFDLG